MTFKAINLVGLLLLALSPACVARNVQVANLSPSAGPVDVFIDGESVAERLSYLAFANLALEPGPHELRVVQHPGTRNVLFSGTLMLREEARLEPLIILAGGSHGAAFEVFVSQSHSQLERPAETFMQPRWPDSDVPSTATAIDVAMLPPAADQRLTYDFSCETGARVLSTMWFGKATTIGLSIPMRQRDTPLACDIGVFNDALGGLELATTTRRYQKTSRILLVGDGETREYELIEVIDGQITARTGVPAVSIRPELDATFAWFDVSRPSQAVSLFEIAAAEVVYGTWQTFTDEGQPSWYLLEGAHDGLPGRRDLLVRQLQDGEPKHFVTVGGGKLFYLDCNRAELRLMLDGDISRTLRIQRVRPVTNCSALSD